MPAAYQVYHWKGIESGQHSEGDISAANETEAKAKIQEQKIVLTELTLIKDSAPKEVEEKAEVDTSKHKGRSVKNRDLMIFTKKFATMIRSGLPMMKTLEMLEDQTENANFKIVVHMIYKDVESGSTLSDAFSHHPAVFDEVYINLLKAGETSGKLTIFLGKLVDQIEKSEKIRAKVKSALTYPTILLIVAGAVITLMLIKVVPVFQQMFTSMGHDLPGPTQFLINVSDFLRNPAGGGIFFAVLFGTIFGARYLIKNNMTVRKKFHKFLLKLPLIKEIIQKATLAKVAMIEGNLSTAGVSVLESLDIVASSINNMIYKEGLYDVKKGIAEGSPLSVLYMKNGDLFPPTFCQMLQVGEETGNMDEMFETTALYYEEEFDMTVDRLTEMLEPLMIVFMGLTIGFMIIAMYMPIFEIGKTMSH